MWDEAAITLLSKEWEAGVHTSVIVNHLKSLGRAETTRNAVLGKVHRLGLVPRKGLGQVVKVRRRRHAHTKGAGAWNCTDRQNAKPATVVLDDPTDFVTVNLIEREADQCAWPVGDPKEQGFGYCGATVAEGRSYCSRHVMRSIDEVKNAPTLKGRLKARIHTSIERTPDLVEMLSGEKS